MKKYTKFKEIIVLKENYNQVKEKYIKFQEN